VKSLFCDGMRASTFSSSQLFAPGGREDEGKAPAGPPALGMEVQCQPTLPRSDANLLDLINVLSLSLCSFSMSMDIVLTIQGKTPFITQRARSFRSSQLLEWSWIRSAAKTLNSKPNPNPGPAGQQHAAVLPWPRRRHYLCRYAP